MTGTQAKATIKRRRIGSLLRQYREACNPKILSKTAASRVGIEPSLLGRIERGEYRVKPAQIEGLLALYGIDDPIVFSELRKAALEPLDSGWWYAYRNEIGQGLLDYINLEDEAEEILSVVPAGIDGLLQSQSYVREIQETSSIPSVRDNADMYVSIRMSRQQILTRTKKPVTIHCIMAETTLHSASPSMDEQIAHLIAMTHRSNVTLQVMPMTAPVGAQINVQSSLLKFKKPWEVVSYTPALGNSVISEDSIASHLFEEQFVELSSQALSVEDTRKLLKERLRRVRNED